MNTTTSWSISSHKKSVQEEADRMTHKSNNFVARMLSSSIVNAAPLTTIAEQEPPPATSLPSDIAARYSSEIAAPKKLKEYEAFASKHKASLLAESKQLSEKFSENLQTAMSIEKTVVGKKLKTKWKYENDVDNVYMYGMYI